MRPKDRTNATPRPLRSGYVTSGSSTPCCPNLRTQHIPARGCIGRGGLGTERLDGEFIKAEDWNTPLAVCRFAFKTPGPLVLKQLGTSLSQRQLPQFCTSSPSGSFKSLNARTDHNLSRRTISSASRENGGGRFHASRDVPGTV